MTYQIGQVLPYTPPPSALAEQISQTWYALRLAPNRYNAVRIAEKKLNDLDVGTFYPTEPKKIIGRRGKPDRVEDRPIIPSYIFAEFGRRPVWHVLKHRRLISGVVCIGDVPYVLRPRDVEQISGFQEAIHQRAAELAAKAAQGLAVGDKVQISPDTALGANLPASAIIDIDGDEVTLEMLLFGVAREVKVAKTSLKLVEAG